jgi:hypothetical protein
MRGDVTRARLEAVLGADDVMSVLARETRARLLNVSASGCLLECGEYLEPGTTGTLKVVVGGHAYDDAVWVTRALQVRGAGVWQMGVEFLWTSHPGSWSLRRMVSRLQRRSPQDVAVAFSTVGPIGGAGVKSLIYRRERSGISSNTRSCWRSSPWCASRDAAVGTAINARNAGR